MSLISNISHKTWLCRRCFSCNCNCSYKIGMGFQRNGHHFHSIQWTMIWSFEGHDCLKLDILHLTCQKFLHLQEQWQWTWIQSLSSQTRPQRSPTDAPHMWCELMRFASSKCMCHGTSIPFDFPMIVHFYVSSFFTSQSCGISSWTKLSLPEWSLIWVSRKKSLSRWVEHQLHYP